MLGFGYVGEIELMDRITSNGLGFIAFRIYQNYIKGHSNHDNFLLCSLRIPYYSIIYDPHTRPYMEPYWEPYSLQGTLKLKGDMTYYLLVLN